jgi:hypothetical protein
MKTKVLSIGAGILVTALQLAAQPVYFLMEGIQGSPGPDGVPDSFLLPLTDPEQIAHAREIVEHGLEAERVLSQLVVQGGADGINRDYRDPTLRPWSWHVVECRGFADVIIDIPGWFMWPEQLEIAISMRDPAEQLQWHSTNSTVHIPVRELGPEPLMVSAVASADHLDLHWSAPGTNYVYTVETAEGAGATNWTSWPGTDWPKRTHQWSIPGPADEKRIFRVRAEREANSTQPTVANTVATSSPGRCHSKPSGQNEKAPPSDRAVRRKPTR